MKSSDFPKSSASYFDELKDDDEVSRVNVRVEEILEPKEGCHQRVYVELVGESRWRFFFIPMNTVLVVNEKPLLTFGDFVPNFKENNHTIVRVWVDEHLWVNPEGDTSAILVDTPRVDFRTVLCRFPRHTVFVVKEVAL
jgi:hypothetical protein